MAADLPALVFLHGGFCDRRDWDRQVDLLRDEFETLALDLPGHGDLPKPASAEIATMARDVVAQLPTETPLMLVGHSLGCAVALEAMPLLKYRLEGLVLIEGGRRTGRNRIEPDALRRCISQEGIEKLLASVVQSWLPDQGCAELAHRFSERLARLDAGYAEALLLESVRWESEAVERMLSNATLPVMVMQSSLVSGSSAASVGDAGTSPWLDLVRSHAPHAAIRIIDDCGHFPHWEKAALVAEHIADFAPQPRSQIMLKETASDALARLRDGKPVLGTIQTFPSATVTEVALQIGMDFIILDCEHGIVDQDVQRASLDRIARSRSFSAVRVKPGDHEAVRFYLQIGADAILMPNVRNAAEASDFVSAARGTGRGSTEPSPDHAPLLFAMIEDGCAVEDIEAIAATPGLSGLVIGPNDLAANLGCVDDFASPIFDRAVTRIEMAAKQAGLMLGGGAYPGFSMARLLAAGHNFILAGSDVAALRIGFRSQLGGTDDR